MSTPSRTPAASVLWGHLLRKNTLAGPPAAPLPPTAPLDKTGTSMRILLHDTQANFEKFSVKVDTLTSGIDQAKREIGIVKDLFQADRESLTLDVVDLVNRSQTQIQKSLGDPAQAPILESFRKEVDARLDGLSKRFDDLQAVIRFTCVELDIQRYVLGQSNAFPDLAKHLPDPPQPSRPTRKNRICPAPPLTSSASRPSAHRLSAK
ncbi:hypothetical protein C8R43DRAFT_1056544 [Mycena crocata]|nr:hypothetical protein C8R43DRAFT_1056544 [Mycena crocata]